MSRTRPPYRIRRDDPRYSIVPERLWRSYIWDEETQRHETLRLHTTWSDALGFVISHGRALRGTLDLYSYGPSLDGPGGPITVRPAETTADRLREEWTP